MKRLMSRLMAPLAKSRKSGRAVPRNRQVRLALECLEVRELLSATPTHWVVEQQPGNIKAGQQITSANCNRDRFRQRGPLQRLDLPQLCQRPHRRLALPQYISNDGNERNHHRVGGEH